MSKIGMIVLAGALAAAMYAADWAAAQSNTAPQTKEAPPLKLADLEQAALRHNPTTAQAEAAIRAAEGRRVQAGLYPNPIVGYEGEEFSFRNFTNKSVHFFFIEQSIITAGKLGKSRNIFAGEKAQAEAEAAAQKQRVLNAVRIVYYEALGAQQLVDLQRQLLQLARDAMSISGELFNLGQADRPDVLEAEVEAQRGEIALLKAENQLARVWRVLAAVINDPTLKPARLDGNLEAAAPPLNFDELAATLLRDSPEIKRAQASVERARAVLVRALAEPKPDLFVRGGIGYSTEVIEKLNRKTGPEAKLELGIRLPLFDRNQGHIAAAQADVLHAEREVQRVELDLRARLADAFRSYNDAAGIAVRYRERIIPRAQQAYELYLRSFRQMAAAYPQVLIAQRTLFQVRSDYVASLVELWQSDAHLRGFLLTGGLSAPERH